MLDITSDIQSLTTFRRRSGDFMKQLKIYNSERPHSSLAYRTPNEFAKTCSELTSGMGATPSGRPSILADRTAVLAGKGSLIAAP